MKCKSSPSAFDECRLYTDLRHFCFFAVGFAIFYLEIVQFVHVYCLSKFHSLHIADLQPVQHCCGWFDFEVMLYQAVMSVLKLRWALSVNFNMFYTYLCYCSGFFDIYNEEKGNMDQHAVSILNVSVTLVYLTVFTVSLIKYCICIHALVVVKLELCFINYMPSVLSHCWFGIRKSIQPVKKWVMRCWCCYVSAVRCRLFAYGPAAATASLYPIISCLI